MPIFFLMAVLFVDHSVASGGYYCQVTGRDPLSESEIEALKDHMQELVESDLPFERKEVPLQEAIEYFHSRGYEDKVRLLNYRKKNYLTLYRLGERMDYHHGYMVPSTGYLRWFDLVYTKAGLLCATRAVINQMNCCRCLNIQNCWQRFFNTETGWQSWELKMLAHSMMPFRMGAVTRLCSSRRHSMNKILARIANQIVDQLDRSRIILIAGPSSAGKTTTSRRLTVQLLALGISPFPLELDNYFLDRDKTPLGEDGKPDFESIDALDLPLLAEHLAAFDRGRRGSIAAIQLQNRDAGRWGIDPVEGLDSPSSWRGFTGWTRGLSPQI